MSANAADFSVLLPHAILATWGLVVLIVDFGALRRASVSRRGAVLGQLSMVGTLLALASAVPPLLHRLDPDQFPSIPGLFGYEGIDFLKSPDPTLFFGTLSGDILTEWFNLIVVAMLALVVLLSTSFDFTEDWGEYYALLFWATVGMLFLLASEELLTLFLSLEMMTICLYLVTAIEKGRRRSAEGGLKYFVYGSVSSALFLYGLSLIYGLTGTTRFEAIDLMLRPGSGDLVGLRGNLAAAAAVLLVMVGFGFKIAAVPFHQWAPDAYEGAPAPVAAWVATGSKVASFIALMKLLLHGLGVWASAANSELTPGWIGVIFAMAAASMTFGNFAALAQTNFKRMLAYSSIAHAGYMLVGVLAAGVSMNRGAAAGAVLFYLVVYGFSNIGAFAVAAWLARDKGTDQIDDLDGLGAGQPFLAVCIVLLMLSLIGMPPLAGFNAKIFMFGEALNDQGRGRATLIWLVGLGLMNSVVSAFYYVRVLKAMFLRPASGRPMGDPTTAIRLPIVLSTAVVVLFGLYPGPMLSIMKSAAVPMLSGAGREGTTPGVVATAATTPSAPSPAAARP